MSGIAVEGHWLRKGNNVPFKSPQMGQPGWNQGELFFCLSDATQKCEAGAAGAAGAAAAPPCQWEDMQHQRPECELLILSAAAES